jgi:hypothetical protein
MTTMMRRRATLLVLALGVGILGTAAPAYASQRSDTPRVVQSTPACTEEDASGPTDAPVCRWDADTAGLGNGGLSFTVYTVPGYVKLYVYDNGADDVVFAWE